MRWTEFNPTTGRIRQSISGCDQLVRPDASSTLGVLEDVLADNSIQYVDLAPGTLTERPACPIALSQAGAVITLTNVDQGTVVRVTGDTFEIIEQDGTDGTLEITFSHPGNYTISVEQFPQLTFSADVNVQ